MRRKKRCTIFEVKKIMQDITIQIKSGDRGKATMPAVYSLASKDEADKKEKQRGDRTEEEEEERGHVRRSIGP